MTAIGLKAQIQALIAQHMAQIDTMMSEAKGKETEAIFAGFAANRDEARKDALEGEISLWDAKKSYGNTAKTQMEYSQIQNADIIRQRVEAKVEKLKSQKNAFTKLLSFLKDKIESLKESQYADNPLVQLFISMMELMAEVVESLTNAEDEKSEILSQANNSQQLNEVIENTEDLVENKKQQSNSLISQSQEVRKSAEKENVLLDNKIEDADKTDASSEAHKLQVMQKIQSVQAKLQADGKDVSVDKLMQVAEVGTENKTAKVVLDKTLESLFNDFANIVGEDNVVINRRDNERRDSSTDRRSGLNPVESENRADVAGRRQGDRRENSSIFLG